MRYLAALLVVVFVDLKYELELRPWRALETCQNRIRSLAQAVERYRQAHGRYPERLAELGSRIPICPTSGFDTYSPAYEPGELGFSLTCGGGPCSHGYFDPSQISPIYRTGAGFVADPAYWSAPRSLGLLSSH